MEVYHVTELTDNSKSIYHGKNVTSAAQIDDTWVADKKACEQKLYLEFHSGND